MQNIFVVTHAQSKHHLEDRVGGWYDTGLTELGCRQALAVAERLAVEVSGPLEIYSSDLKRAAETANIIGDHLNVPVTLDDGFRENSYGEADGKSQAWLSARIVPAPEHDRMDHLVVEGAESKRNFVTRIYDSMARLPDTENIIIVTHGYAMTFVIAHWIGLPLEHASYVNFRSSPGGITLLKKDDFFRNNGVIYLNKSDHLIGLD